MVIPPRQILALSLSSAARDGSRYPDPARLELNRRPNGVLGFGHGPHYCIGAPLARMQSEIALGSLLDRFPHGWPPPRTSRSGRTTHCCAACWNCPVRLRGAEA